jgi:hypothetical protein
MKKLNAKSDVQSLSALEPEENKGLVQDSQLLQTDTMLPPAPEPDGQPPQGPEPDAHVPDVSQGPEANIHKRVQARHTQNRAIDGIKCKRKRTSTICCEQLFTDVKQQFLQETITAPPLMHTPHSLFRMLCESFEQQFPNCLPQGVVEQILLSLQKE